MKKKFRDYEQTIKFVRSLKIKNYKNWNTYCNQATNQMIFQHILNVSTKKNGLVGVTF